MDYQRFHRRFKSLFEEVDTTPILENWKGEMLQKIYAFLIVMGLPLFFVGMIASYLEGLFFQMVALGVLYISGVLIFLKEWKRYSTGVMFFLLYLYGLGNLLMYTATDEIFGAIWLVATPVIASVFYGTAPGLFTLLVSSIMLVFWGAMSTLGITKWNIGTTSDPIISWLSLIGIVILLDSILIFTFSAAINSYSRILEAKLDANKELEEEKNKLKLTNSLLQLEIENASKLEADKKAIEKKLRNIFDASQDIYAIYDRNGKLIDINAEATNKLKYSKTELLEQSSSAARLANLEYPTDRLSDDNPHVIFEDNIYDFEGNPTPVEYNIKKISLDDGEYYLSIIRDITHRKEVEKEVEKLNRELHRKVLERTAQFDDAMQELKLEIKNRLNTEAELRRTKKILEENLREERSLSEMKTRFVSMISHEYRTPLTIIYTCTDILDFVFEQRDKELFAKNIQRIKTSVSAMINLLEDVLVIGRTEMKDIKAEIKPFNLEVLLKETIDELNITDNYEHSIVLRYLTDSEIVDGDQKLTQYIIRNFITNAQKYSPTNTEIVVSVGRRDGYLDIAVRDSGIGIPDKDIPLLFEPFHRSSNVEARPGTGLGLAICKKYADATGSHITIDSELGRGSVFTLRVPQPDKNDD